MTCRHPHAQEIHGELCLDGWDSLAVIVEPVGNRPFIDRWCPTCGAIRVWKNDNGRTEWRRPRADGGKTGGS